MLSCLQPDWCGVGGFPHRASQFAAKSALILKRLCDFEFSEGHFFSDRVQQERRDRKSTRLNSSHVEISYAVFCLKKKTSRRSRKMVLSELKSSYGILLKDGV